MPLAGMTPTPNSFQDEGCSLCGSSLLSEDSTTRQYRQIRNSRVWGNTVGTKSRLLQRATAWILPAMRLLEGRGERGFAVVARWLNLEQ